MRPAAAPWGRAREGRWGRLCHPARLTDPQWSALRIGHSPDPSAPTIRPPPTSHRSVLRPDPGALETRRPAGLVKRSLLDESEDRRTITATGTANPLTQRGATTDRFDSVVDAANPQGHLSVRRGALSWSQSTPAHHHRATHRPCTSDRQRPRTSGTAGDADGDDLAGPQDHRGGVSYDGQEPLTPRRDHRIRAGSGGIDATVLATRTRR